VRDIQQAVERTADALTNVQASVSSINEIDDNLRAALEQQTAELDAIALRAGNVAAQVAGALPDIRSAVGHLDHAGQSVLGTAES
jgi:methyl-accepting chemotaxis protein